MEKIVSPGNYSGKIVIPSSKSDTQRALLVASLSSGISLIHHVGNSKDEQAMLLAIQELGAKVKEINKNSLEIIGIETISQEKSIYLGESGLGFRLMCSVSAIFSQKITLNGSGSLLNRPMNFFEETLTQLGAKVNSDTGFPPISILGPMTANSIKIDGSLSSQFLSGLLIALPLLSENSQLEVIDLKSKAYVEMTINTLNSFGIKIDHTNFKTFEIKGQQKVKACEYFIEGDWSSASYWLVASALGFDVSVENLKFESLQADKEILEVFKKANCNIISENNTLKIDGSQRTNFTFDATDCPDLFPALATFAALTPGENILIGTERLIHKESNRAESLFAEFTKLGIDIKLEHNRMIINGKNHVNGGIVESHNDHRIAMCLAILGMKSNSPISIQEAESVAKSYPSFWTDLNSLIP